MAKWACCHEGCSAVICLDDHVEIRMRKTHEWWTCPFGHRQRFIEQSEQEKRIEQLERQVEYYKDRMMFWMEDAVQWRKCQWPGCRTNYRYTHPQNLWKHMVTKHGVPKLAEVKHVKAG